MRGALLALVILQPARPAAADSAPSCRLTPAECAVVLREVTLDAGLFAQDQEIVELGLSPRDRADALIKRDEDRMTVRYRQLPAQVAAEIARVRVCQSLGGAASDVPQCR